MAGKRQKHPNTLAFRRGGRGRQLATVEGEERPVPPCPEVVSEEAREAWERLWRSPLKNAIAETDLPALYRWLWWFDRWVLTAADIMRRGPTTRGARGDEVLRPKVRFLKTCEDALARLEEAFGLTPLARMRVGITFHEGRSALKRMQASSERDGEEEDPRLVLQRQIDAEQKRARRGSRG